MDTLSIINTVELKEIESLGITTIKISISAHHYLCNMAMKPNLFSNIQNCFIEMDFNYFIDLIAIAHMAEVDCQQKKREQHIASKLMIKQYY